MEDHALRMIARRWSVDTPDGRCRCVAAHRGHLGKRCFWARIAEQVVQPIAHIVERATRPDLPMKIFIR
jgi:hypothetical protein